MRPDEESAHVVPVDGYDAEMTIGAGVAYKVNGFGHLVAIATTDDELPDEQGTDTDK